MKLHLYKLDRKKDINGNSGIGEVAYAIGIPSGKVILWWTTEISSVTLYDSITNAEDLHSHKGATLIKSIENPKELLELFGFDPEALLRKRKRKTI